MHSISLSTLIATSWIISHSSHKTCGSGGTVNFISVVAPELKDRSVRLGHCVETESIMQAMNVGEGMVHRV
jgi:hypothetical protein